MLNVTSGHLGNNFTIVHSIILTAGAVGIIFYGLKFLCKYISRLKAEQKIFLNNDKLSHISGGHLIEIEKKYILEIKQTRNFYRLNVSWAISDKMTFHFFRIHFPHLNPYIPRRVTFKTEMVQLASLLNTAYKESSLFNTCKSC
jgi:predicted membrane protein